jgi:peroxiredoxin Q/BCP
MLQARQTAPDFEATLDDGSKFKLSDYRGHKNVVLYFYPADFTSGCTAQACSFRDNYSAIAELDAIVVGVSRDSAERHSAFKAKYHIEYPIITDPGGVLAKLFEVTSSLPAMRPRITYVIDKAGVIRSASRHDIAIGRHLSDTLKALEEIQTRARNAA